MRPRNAGKVLVHHHAGLNQRQQRGQNRVLAGVLVHVEPVDALRAQRLETFLLLLLQQSSWKQEEGRHSGRENG
jgi:hypothetical protein